MTQCECITREIQRKLYSRTGEQKPPKSEKKWLVDFGIFENNVDKNRLAYGF